MSQELKDKIIEEIRWCKKKSYQQAKQMGITEDGGLEGITQEEITKRADARLGEDILNALNRIFQLIDELDVQEGKPLQR